MLREQQRGRCSLSRFIVSAPPPRVQYSIFVFLHSLKTRVVVGLTVNDDGDGGKDGEENHDEGGIALAGISLGPGIMYNLLGVAKELANHDVLLRCFAPVKVWTVRRACTARGKVIIVLCSSTRFLLLKKNALEKVAERD